MSLVGFALQGLSVSYKTEASMGIIFTIWLSEKYLRYKRKFATLFYRVDDN